MGLHEETETWDYITEEEYQALHPIVGNVLPSMTISKVKTDKNGSPTRAKYQIVVLGNLVPPSDAQTHWSIFFRPMGPKMVFARIAN